MLIDQNDTEPGAEERHALRAKVLGHWLGQIVRGHGIVDVVNAASLLILESVAATIAEGDAVARAGIADQLRHVASHVDLTCPHVAQEDKGPSGEPLH